jgi:hypothetical protein
MLAFLDIGPELIVHENIPIEESDLDLKSISLGIYLSLVVSQGKGSNPQPGLYGPLPWSELPDHTFLVFAFFIHDPSVIDPRAREGGIMTYVVIVLPKDEDELIQARIGLERSLKQALIKTDSKPYVIPNDEPLFLLSQLKMLVWKTIVEGEKLLQEKALESVLDNDLVDSLSIVDLNDLEYVLPIKNDIILTKLHRDIIENSRTLMSIVRTKEFFIGFYRVKELNKMVIIQMAYFIEEEKIITVFEQLIKAIPLIQQYFF